jgi:hypothetical protein
MQDTENLDPNSHAAIHGVTCRRCGLPWPCDGSSSWEGRHFPSRIPNGAVVTTTDDLDRLVTWAPGATCSVVLDATGVAWILFADDDGDYYAGTIECPDNGTPDRYDIENLPADRGSLYVLFNGDREALTDMGEQK